MKRPHPSLDLAGLSTMASEVFSNNCSSSFFFAGSSCQIISSALRVASARWPDWSQFAILIAVNTNVKYTSTVPREMSQNCAEGKVWNKTVHGMTFCESAWAQVTVVLFCGSCWPAPSHLWNCRDSTASGPENARHKELFTSAGYLHTKNSLDKCAPNFNFTIQGAKW